MRKLFEKNLETIVARYDNDLTCLINYLCRAYLAQNNCKTSIIPDSLREELSDDLYLFYCEHLHSLPMYDKEGDLMTDIIHDLIECVENEVIIQVEHMGHVGNYSQEIMLDFPEQIFGFTTGHDYSSEIRFYGAITINGRIYPFIKIFLK